MSAAGDSIEVILNLISQGDGGKVTLEQIKALQKAAEDLGPAGQQAFDALDKLGKTTAGNDAANDLRQRAKAMEELAQATRQASEVGFTGTGLASDPSQFLEALNQAQKRSIQLTGEQIQVARRLEESLEATITRKRLVNAEYQKEAEMLQRVRTALAPVGLEEERRTKVLEELKKKQEDGRRAQQESTEAIDKGTKSTSALKDGVRSLSLEFPHLAQAMRAIVSPAGAVAGALVLIVKGIIEMGRQRDGVRALNLEYEQLQNRVQTIGDIQNAVSKARQSMVDDYSAIIGQVVKFNEAMDEQARTAQSRQAIEEKIDDETLRGRLLDIDASNKPESEKGLLRSKAMQEARKRKEQRNLDFMAAGSKRDFEAADAARGLKSELEAKAAAMDPQLAAAEDAVTVQGGAEAATKLFAEEQRAKNNQKLLYSQGLLAEGPIYMARHPEQSAKILTEFGDTPLDKIIEELKRRDADLADTLKKEEDATKQAADALKDLTKERDNLLAQAKAAKDRADALDQSGRTKRVDYNNAMEGARQVGPLREANDQREAATEFNRRRLTEVESALQRTQSALGRIETADGGESRAHLLGVVSEIAGQNLNNTEQVIQVIQKLQAQAQAQAEEIKLLKSQAAAGRVFDH